MFEERGVRQIPGVDGVTTIICRTKEGAVVRSITLSASCPDDWVAWEIRKAEQWLNRYDPPLRLVSGGHREPPRMLDPRA
jgi:hypothetical protein